MKFKLKCRVHQFKYNIFLVTKSKFRQFKYNIFIVKSLHKIYTIPLKISDFQMNISEFQLTKSEFHFGNYVALVHDLNLPFDTAFIYGYI